jgi:AcrR family transcriptional regulator
MAGSFTGVASSTTDRAMYSTTDRAILSSHVRRPIRPKPTAIAKPPPAGEARTPRTRRRRSDGERSHQEILRAAAALASVEGLDGLSIASLAEHVGLSKSGLFAHFRSKEELQLETIRMAEEIFQEEVVRPGLAAPAGVARVRALVLRFLDHVRRRTFPGGCFFASVSAEVDGHPGKLRDVIAAKQRAWFGLFEQGIEDAQRLGEVDRRAEAPQVAFEVLSMLAGAHGTFLLQGNAAVLDRARRGVDAVLSTHAGKRARPTG